MAVMRIILKSFYNRFLEVKVPRKQAAARILLWTQLDSNQWRPRCQRGLSMIVCFMQWTFQPFSISNISNLSQLQNSRTLAASLDESDRPQSIALVARWISNRCGCAVEAGKTELEAMFGVGWIQTSIKRSYFWKVSFYMDYWAALRTSW